MRRLYFSAMLETTSLRLWGLFGRALSTLLMERDFVETCLNADGDGVFILLAESFGSGSFAKKLYTRFFFLSRSFRRYSSYFLGSQYFLYSRSNFFLSLSFFLISFKFFAYIFCNILHYSVSSLAPWLLSKCFPNTKKRFFDFAKIKLTAFDSAFEYWALQWLLFFFLQKQRVRPFSTLKIIYVRIKFCWTEIQLKVLNFLVYQKWVSI